MEQGLDNHKPVFIKKRKLTGLIASIVLLLIVFFCAIYSTLPKVNVLNELLEHPAPVEIYDHIGRLIYTYQQPVYGEQKHVDITEISPYLIAATIAAEDSSFFQNPGFDIHAILRAVMLNFQNQRIVSGGSTITQQVVKNILLSDKERYERSIDRKIREAFLAYQVNRHFSKDDVLSLYLNETYYGNYAYGAEAAAQYYFGVSAKELDMEQAAFIAGLPQAPNYYGNSEHYQEASERQGYVLGRMVELSRRNNCINIGSERESLCVSPNN